MACLDHVCRRCGHGWFSNTTDENCELCGSDDINDYFDEPEDDWPDESSVAEEDYDDAA